MGIVIGITIKERKMKSSNKTSRKLKNVKVGSHDPIFSSNYSSAHFLRQQLDVWTPIFDKFPIFFMCWMKIEHVQEGNRCRILQSFAPAFTISLKLGFIPHVWKIAVLCMLIKPDKPPSQTTSYRPISLLSAIMKLFERVIEKRLRKHLEDNGFFSKYQSGFRKSKSTNDHLFRLSQTIMESFNRGEHVIAAFLDVEKAFDNVWHNGLRYKIYQLDLPTKLYRWLSDFLVGRVIQVKIEGFLSPKVYPKAGVLQGSNLSPLLFLIYVNDMPNPSHHQTDKSQFADDEGQWAVSKNIDLAAEYLQRDIDKLARWCAKWRIKLNPEKTKVIIFSKSRFAIRAEPALSLYGDLLSYYPQIEFLGITFDNRMTFTKHFEEILERCKNFIV